MSNLDVLRVPENESETVTQWPPKRQSFWCWIRRHRMIVAGFNYHFECGSWWQGNMEAIHVCQCKLNDAAVPTFADQLRRTGCLQ